MLGLVRFSALVLFVALSSLAAIAQTQDSYEYQSEFTWGINKNTSGGLIGGFTFKKARKLSDRQLESFGLEVMNVKHPQERRVNSETTGNSFIFRKTNYLYALRFQYGRDFILFKKAPQQGVEIKAVFAAGPSLGIVAPYYIERQGEGGSITVHEQYKQGMSVSNIYGTGKLFEGLGDSEIALGLNLKAALNFELGIVKSQVTGFEAGFLLDAYSKEIVLVTDAKNYSLFPTLFITLFYGSRK
jgi:hypothetical protein